LKQMKQFSGRLLTKATKLHNAISATINAESDVSMMRSDRAADVSMETGYSNRHRHRKHGRKTPFTGRITSRISRYSYIFTGFYIFLIFIIVILFVHKKMYIKHINKSEQDNKAVRSALTAALGTIAIVKHKH